MCIRYKTMCIHILSKLISGQEICVIKHFVVKNDQFFLCGCSQKENSNGISAQICGRIRAGIYLMARYGYVSRSDVVLNACKIAFCDYLIKI